MTEDVVVLGSGYAGTGTILSLEERLDGEADLTWVSDVDHHLVLHEAHRVIRDPSIRDRIRFPVSEIKSPGTRFVHGSVEDVDVDERTVHLADGSTVEYDYLVVALGSRTAFYGIPGGQTEPEHFAWGWSPTAMGDVWRGKYSQELERIQAEAETAQAAALFERAVGLDPRQPLSAGRTLLVKYSHALIW